MRAQNFGGTIGGLLAGRMHDQYRAALFDVVRIELLLANIVWLVA